MKFVLSLCATATAVEQTTMLQTKTGGSNLAPLVGPKHDCAKKDYTCRNPQSNSDLCLTSKAGWGISGGPELKNTKKQWKSAKDSTSLCVDNVEYCAHPFWGKDMLSCCPGACAAAGYDTSDAPANANRYDPDASVKKTLHASVLHFVKNPWYVEENTTYEYFEDGYLQVGSHGLITGVGNWADLSARDQLKADHYPGRLIVPGFIDTHIHAPQTEMIAAYGESLIPWLNTYTFPTESKFADTEHAADRAETFVTELLRAGTTTALTFATRHQDATDVLFEEFTKRNMRMIAGQVLMDDSGNAPDILRDVDAETSIAETEELIKKWHNNGRNLYAITPRFAPTSTLHQMNLTGELMKKYPDVYMHTHLSESMNEIGWVNWQFGGKFGAEAERHLGATSTNPYGATKYDGTPADWDEGPKGYLAVYDHFGMLGPKSIMAHSIHISESEWDRLKETDTTVSWCPTSNNFLGSGLFNAKQAVEHNVRFGMGTDVGAGTTFSILKTMGDAYKVLKLGESWLKNVDPFMPDAAHCSTLENHLNYPECGLASNDVVLSAIKSFYTATLGGANQLSIDDKVGNFEVGKEADFVVLNLGGGREFVSNRLKDEFLNGQTDADKLWEKLFVLMMMGDERHVEATYVMGKPQYIQ